MEVNNDIIFIEGNLPSLKNSKIKTVHGIFSSKTVKAYLSSLGIQRYSPSRKEVLGYVTRPNKFEQLREPILRAINSKEGFPIIIGFHIVRNSKRSWDFNNINQIILDLLTAHDMIPDDCIQYILPIPMSIDGILPNETNIRQLEWYSVDKNNMGVYLKIY